MRSHGGSGGPKTEEGKEASKMNAIRHGILSTHLLVSTGDPEELENFIEFHAALCEETQPAGMLEMVLVDRLAATLWRLKRLYIAEAGFIGKQVATHMMQFMFDKMEQHGAARRDAANTFYKRIRTKQGCMHVATLWQAVLEKLEENGLPLSESAEYNIRQELGGDSGYFRVEAFCVVNRAVREKDIHPLKEGEEKGMNEWAMRTAKDLQKFFASIADILEDDEEEERKADKKTKMIPAFEELEKLQRYDAHLQRVMMQTLHELQRVQSARLGTPTPLAAALDVTLNSE